MDIIFKKELGILHRVFPKIVTGAGILLGLWLGARYLLPLLLPFLLGAGLALLAEPMVRLFSGKFRLPRGIAAAIGVSMAFCFLFLLLALLAALAVKELRTLAGVLPDLGNMAKTGIGSLAGWLQGITQLAPEGLREPLSRSIGEFFTGGTDLLDRGVGYVLGLAGGILTHIPDGALGMGTAIISSFMISAKLPGIRQWLTQLLPRQKLGPVLETLGRIRSALGGWVKAQVKLAAMTWAILAAGFLILRIPYAPLWALLVAGLDAFPVLGTGTILLPWSLICLLQGDTARCIGLLGIYAAAALIRSVLEPRLVGRHLGLDPLVTLFALYAGYKIAGLPGMLLAPMAAMTVANTVTRGTTGP